MDLPNSRLEWQLNIEEDASARKRPDPVEGDRPIPQEVTSQPRLHRLYELILGLAALFGIIIFLIWQWSGQRMTVMETELAILREELAQLQSAKIVDVENANVHAASHHHIETEHLHFVTNAQNLAFVEAVRGASDDKDVKLHQDFGLPLSASDDKLTVILDPAENMREAAEEDLTYGPLPNEAMAPYALTEVDPRIEEIFSRLSKHVLDKALSKRAIKPQWQAMTLGLQIYFQQENGSYSEWWLETYSYRRRLPSTWSIDQVLLSNSESFDPALRMDTPNWSASEVAGCDPLIAFILESYGYAYLPSLLDAFEIHDDWETLAPAVFGISANEFEENWHTFVEERYP